MKSIEEYLGSGDVGDVGDDAGIPGQEAGETLKVKLPDFLLAKTGPGNIESYINHPLNVKDNAGLAQIIRGLTGMFNSLDYAVVDIIVGAFRFFTGKGGPDSGP